MSTEVEIAVVETDTVRDWGYVGSPRPMTYRRSEVYAYGTSIGAIEGSVSECAERVKIENAYAQSWHRVLDRIVLLRAYPVVRDGVAYAGPCGATGRRTYFAGDQVEDDYEGYHTLLGEIVDRGELIRYNFNTAAPGFYVTRQVPGDDGLHTEHLRVEGVTRLLISRNQMLGEGVKATQLPADFWPKVPANALPPLGSTA